MKVWKRWFFEQKTTFIIRQMNVKFLSRISKIWKLPHSSGPMTGHGTIKNLYLLNQYFKCMSFEEETNGGEEKTRTVWEIIHLAAHYFFIITGVAGTLRRGEQGDDRQRKMATARKHHRITCKCNARPYFIEKRRRRLRSKTWVTEQYFHILFTAERRACCSALCVGVANFLGSWQLMFLFSIGGACIKYVCTSRKWEREEEEEEYDDG